MPSLDEARSSTCPPQPGISICEAQKLLSDGPDHQGFPEVDRVSQAGRPNVYRPGALSMLETVITLKPRTGGGVPTWYSDWAPTSRRLRHVTRIIFAGELVSQLDEA